MQALDVARARPATSMKVPPKRKGNSQAECLANWDALTSMKVPPKRKGNLGVGVCGCFRVHLNESPSEKEGKSNPFRQSAIHPITSMKVPPKRKGNFIGVKPVKE